MLWLTLSSHFTSPFKATAANDCTVKASSTDLGIALIAMNASQPHTFTAGSYPIDLQGVTAFTLKYDVRCAHHFPNALPSSGTVTLTAVDSTHVTGSYDLTFPGTTGGRIQGTFDAPRGTLPFNACDGLGIGGGTSGPGCSSVTCQP